MTALSKPIRRDDPTKGHAPPRLPVRLLSSYLPPVLVLLLLVGLWAAYVAAFRVPFYILPGPRRVFSALTEHGWAYLPDVWTTTQEILAGFALGAAVALLLAAAISQSPPIARAVYPLLISSQMVPLFVVAVVVTIAFQEQGLLPQIVVTALYSFFPMVVNGSDGLRRVDQDLVNLLRAAGASSWKIFRMVRVPAALPAVFSGAKLAMVFAVSSAPISEWIGGSSGLGYLMRFENNQFDTPAVFATTVVLTLLGVALFLAVGALEYLVLPWHRQASSDVGGLWRT